MIVEDLTPQAVRHDSGAIVAGTGRHTFAYARAGRVTSLSVEPLETYFVRLRADAAWDDGTPLTEDERRVLIADVTATFEHWGERCEFVLPGDPRILSTLDQIETYIRAEALR